MWVDAQESEDPDDTLPGRYGMLSVEEQKEVAAQMRAERSRAKTQAKKKTNRFTNMFRRKPKTAADQVLARKIKSQKALLKAQQKKEKAAAGGNGLLSKLSFRRGSKRKKATRVAPGSKK